MFYLSLWGALGLESISSLVNFAIEIIEIQIFDTCTYKKMTNLKFRGERKKKALNCLDLFKNAIKTFLRDSDFKLCSLISKYIPISIILITGVKCESSRTELT